MFQRAAFYLQFLDILRRIRLCLEKLRTPEIDFSVYRYFLEVLGEYEIRTLSMADGFCIKPLKKINFGRK